MNAHKRGWIRALSVCVCAALLLPAVVLAAQTEPLPSDVDEDAWYAPYVRICLADGLMGTFEDGTFRPQQRMSVADLIALTAQLWSESPDEYAPVEPSWLEPLDEIWQADDTISTGEPGLDFTYSDALDYVHQRDNGSLWFIEQRLKESGMTVAETMATRGDLCALLGGNMPSPVYLRKWSLEAEDLEFGAYRMYMAGVMIGTGYGFALDSVLTRGEAATFLVRLTHTELRIPDELPPHHELEELMQIELSFMSFGNAFLDYKLNLTKGELWRYQIDSLAESSNEERNSGADDGYQACRKLGTEQVATLRSDTAFQRALTWGHHYQAADIFDGLQWSMTLSFSDGSVWEIDGSNAFPEGWDAFFAVFNEGW